VARAGRVSKLDLEQIIRQGECMTVEFKSDRGPLEDSDLLDSIVCLAMVRVGYY